MAITSGTYYFGPGESLTNFTDIANEINGQTFTGDVTFIQTENINLSASVTFISINKNNYKLRFNSANHYGNPNLGYSIILDPGMNIIL